MRDYKHLADEKPIFTQEYLIFSLAFLALVGWGVSLFLIDKLGALGIM